MTNPVHNFFENFVRRSYTEFVRNPASEYHAKNAVMNSNIMAERVWHWLRPRDPAKVFNASNPGRYRQELVANVCADFQLVWDIADGHKHWELTRRSRRVTSATQTEARGGWDNSVWDQDGYDEAPRMVVTLDDGTERLVVDVVTNVMTMWEHIVRAQL